MADLTRIRSRSGAPFTVGGRFADRFQGLLYDLEDAGYTIDAKQSGGYNPRFIAGTRTPSQHSFGRAIDINWTDNPRGAAGKIPADLARDLAKKHGMVWGGDWKNPDPMHFEVVRDGPVPMAQRGLTSFAGLGGPPAAESDLPPILKPGSTEFWNQNRAAPSDTPEEPAMARQPMMMGPMQTAGSPGLIESLMNPMTMAGLSILGSPTRDVSQGMQVGMQAQMQGAKMEELRRQRGIEEQRRAAYMGLLSDPEVARSLPPGMARIAGSMDPERGALLLSQLTDPARELERQYKEAQIEKMKREVQTGGADPATVREWQHFNRLSPEDQQRYLTMKRAEKYLDTGTEFVRPNPVAPGENVATVPKNIADAEAQKEIGAEKGKREMALPKARASMRALETQHRNVKATIERAMPMVNAWTSGLAGQSLSRLGGTDAANLRALLNTVKSNLGFDKLQDMRDNSPTGGALGQVSNIELELLQSAFASVEQSQKPEQLRENLTYMLGLLDEMQDNRRAAFDDTYGESRRPQPAAPKTYNWTPDGGLQEVR